MAGGIVLNILGVVCFCVGAFMLWSGFNTADYISELEKLPRLSAVAASDGDLGRECYIEGRLSERNQPLIEGFLVYVRSEYRGQHKTTSSSPKRPRWREDLRETPTLILEEDGSAISLVGQGYSIGNASAVWVSTETLEVGETKRYEGFKAGDEVVAVGKIVEGENGRALEVTALWGGRFEDYLSAYRGGFDFSVFIGAGLLIVGGALIGIGIKILT